MYSYSTLVCVSAGPSFACAFDTMYSVRDPFLFPTFTHPRDPYSKGGEDGKPPFVLLRSSSSLWVPSFGGRIEREGGRRFRFHKPSSRLSPHIAHKGTLPYVPLPLRERGKAKVLRNLMVPHTHTHTWLQPWQNALLCARARWGSHANPISAGGGREREGGRGSNPTGFWPLPRVFVSVLWDLVANECGGHSQG